MVLSHIQRRRCYAALLLGSLLLVSRAKPSSSSSLLQVATDDLEVDSAAVNDTHDVAASYVGNVPSDKKTPPSLLRPIPDNTSSSDNMMQPPNIEPTASNANAAAAEDSLLNTTSTNDTSNETTAPLFPFEFSRWKIPPAWTAPWNDTSNEEEEIDYNQYDDEKTYLDIFGEVTKEFLTQRVIPSTDLECDWNWKHLRCEPYCHCELYPMWGDYHIGRTCRQRDGPPSPYRTPPPSLANVSSSSVAEHPPALSPCEFEGDVPSPLLRVRKLVQDQLDEVTPVVQSIVYRWQYELQQLLRSPKSVKAQQTVSAWIRVAHYKLYKWQTQACANVPCPEANDDSDEVMNATKPTDAATERRPPGPWVWSQRFLCNKLPFSDKCNNSNNGQEGQRMFPFPPEEDFYHNAHSKTFHATENASSQPPTTTTTEQPQTPPTFHRFTGWAKKD